MITHAINGGRIAHILRRFIHVSILFVPLFYYYFIVHLATPKILHLLILAFIFLVFLFEKFRVRMRLVLFGQRLHEASHISAFAWTILSLGVLLILCPSVNYAIPIVATCALVDPLVGEMRAHHCNKKYTVICGVILALIIWLVCAWFYVFPLWIACLIAPISVAAEWPSLKWIDDNALMLLIPLMIILLIQ